MYTSENKNVQKRLGLICGLVYGPRELPRVTRVDEVLQMVSETILTISRACTGQLRRIRWHTS
jgi:hypothetical protein